MNRPTPTKTVLNSLRKPRAKPKIEAGGKIEPGGKLSGRVVSQVVSIPAPGREEGCRPGRGL